jgi:alpha-beta hydrolase superfamily lysophospholipase
MEPKETCLKLKTGEKIYGWYVAPELNPKAIVCLCHGWGEHSLRYKHWAERFLKYGYGFFAWDHYGHGQSEGKRGHIRNFGVFMEEINLVLSKASMLFPGSPIVLYGHSMGGNIAINFALREHNPFRLLIATSPWLKLTNKPSAILSFLVKILNGILPALQINAPLNAEGISHVPEIVESYRTDPLNHSKITPRLLTEINKASDYAIANIEKLEKPFLLIHGDSDPVTQYKESFEMSKKVKTCSFIPFKDMYHELHNETINEEVFRMIKEWISGNLEF